MKVQTFDVTFKSGHSAALTAAEIKALPVSRLNQIEQVAATGVETNIKPEANSGAQ